MELIGRVSVKTMAVGLVAFIVLGGFVVALFSGASSGQGPFAPATSSLNPGGIVTNLSGSVQNAASSQFGFTGGIASRVTETSTTTMSVPAPPQSVVLSGNPPATKSSTTGFSQPGNGSLIEFFSNVTMESPTPSTLAAQISQLAYSAGGYVAYQSTLTSSAYLVVRVPAPDYQQVLSQIRGMGNVTSLTSNSNDVTVKYNDLNATLASLVAERNDLIKLMSQSTSVNSTLAIEAQLQAVNAQINSVQSEILQTQRLITYSTISVSITKSAEARPLSLTLSATPKSGVSPLGVTFNAVVSGGEQPYVVNYNFGDGSSEQGQIVIHQFYGADDYNVTVTVTDSKGSVASTWAIIHVTEPPTKIGFGNFGTSLETLVIQVVEGMAEVAVVVLPIALVAGAVVYPFARKNRAQKEIRQS